MHTPIFSVIALLITISHVPSCLSSAKQPVTGFQATLIHRDSPLSPFYNPNMTTRERTRAALRRSNARLKYFQTRQSGQSVVNPNVRNPTASLAPSGGEYIMRFYLGTPAVEVWGVVDTGSGLTWLQCLPCENCYKMTRPPFDPSKSVTFQKMTCKNPICDYMTKLDDICFCNNQTQECMYREEYLDGSKTIGNMAYETFTLDETDSTNFSNPNFMFGCGHDNQGIYEGDMAGIVGLSRAYFSVIQQIVTHKFSYCFKSRISRNPLSTIRFGDNAVVTGKSTPIVTVKNAGDLYYVSLEAISVGSEKLALPPGIFNATEQGTGGFLVDSGATFTHLIREAHDALVQEMDNQTPFLTRAADPNYDFALCYAVESFDDLEITPSVTLHFTGADVVLDKIGTFYEADEEVWCLAVLPATEGSILGNLAQENFIVGYDLSSNFVSFKNDDCSNH